MDSNSYVLRHVIETEALAEHIDEIAQLTAALNQQMLVTSLRLNPDEGQIILSSINHGGAAGGSCEMVQLSLDAMSPCGGRIFGDSSGSRQGGGDCGRDYAELIRFSVAQTHPVPAVHQAYESKEFNNAGIRRHHIQRTVTAVQGFRQRSDRWPTRVHLYPEVITELYGILGERLFLRVQSRLYIVVDVNSNWQVADGYSDSFSAADDMLLIDFEHREASFRMATDWLGVSELA